MNVQSAGEGGRKSTEPDQGKKLPELPKSYVRGGGNISVLQVLRMMQWELADRALPLTLYIEDGSVELILPSVY